MSAMPEKLPVETILTKGRRSANPVIQGLQVERLQLIALRPFGRLKSKIGSLEPGRLLVKKSQLNPRPTAVTGGIYVPAAGC
jgi:hypothetical protein